MLLKELQSVVQTGHFSCIRKILVVLGGELCSSCKEAGSDSFIQFVSECTV
jgi:hypothetical protein